MLYAVVDIETTGGYADAAGITEIAIVITDGVEVMHVWSSLINPQRPIPRFIAQLTGIHDEMVQGAPFFREVAAHVHELLQDKIFVAHNVNFDYSFVKSHLEASGYSLNARKLCTVRLARKVKPGLSSYSLGKLCHSLGIEHEDAHRALGDAMATTRLLHLLHSDDSEGHIRQMLKGHNREQYLPPNLPVAQLDALPEKPGVYYFYDAKGRVIYVGKASNLIRRVKSHFANNKTGRQKADFLREIHHVSFRITATDLMAQILESVEIRRLWPRYNRSQRGFHPRYGLYVFEDRQGYLRLVLEKHRPHFPAVHTFQQLHEGREWLQRLAMENELCLRLCGLAPGADCRKGIFAEGCKGQCCSVHVLDYNHRVQAAIDGFRNTLPTLALIGIGRSSDEYSCILMEAGVFLGMGYLNQEADAANLEHLRNAIELMPDNDFIRSLIFRAAQNPEMNLLLFNPATGRMEHCERGEAKRLDTSIQ